jgi:hypothetical protein
VNSLAKQEATASSNRVEVSQGQTKLAEPLLKSKVKDYDPATLWQAILAKLPASTKALFTTDLNASVMEIRDQEILIGIADSKDAVKKRERKEIAMQRRPELETAAREILGQQMQIRYKFVAGLEPVPPLSQEIASSGSEKEETTPATPTSPNPIEYHKPDEEVALKNIVGLFNGQIICLEDTNSDS